jgi:hypothetical protein
VRSGSKTEMDGMRCRYESRRVARPVVRFIVAIDVTEVFEI